MLQEIYRLELEFYGSSVLGRTIRHDIDKDAIDTRKTLAKMVHFGRKQDHNETNFDILLFLTGEKTLCNKSCKNEENLNGLAFTEGACYGTGDQTWLLD